MTGQIILCYKPIRMMKYDEFVTHEEFLKRKDLPRKEFNQSAKERFSRLDIDYITKKYYEEKFPVEGNVALIKSVGNIIESKLKEWKEKDEIVIVDIGAAGGALTTLFMLAELNRLELLKNVRLTLVDISRRALEATLSGDFILPAEMFFDFGYDFKSECAKTFLKKANIVVRSAVSLEKDFPVVDIVLSAFTHHHMNITDKELATREMERVTKSGGIIGVVDECLDYDDYINWIRIHKNERNTLGELVPIAAESFITLEEHKRFFKQTTVVSEGKTRYFYYFCGIKL